MSKRIIFEISHPKHFHQFKYLINHFREVNKVKIIARDKDVVLNLLDEEGLSYEKYGIHGKTMFQKYSALPAILKKYWQIVSRFKPDLIISRSSPYAAIISKFFSAKAVVLPDSEVVSFNNNFVVPLSDYVITPGSYELDHGKKHYKVNGFFESAYLHSRYFLPDDSIFSDLGLSKDERFFVIRFVGWFANHDTDKRGFSEEQKINLVKHLEKKGKVLISGEGKLNNKLKPYQINIEANKIHSLLYHASLYIGDSQTMATEAALLGTPSIRYNSFVGENDMSNFKILQEEYELLINASKFEDVVKNADQLIHTKNVKEVFKSRKKRYFSETGDVNKETELLIENFLEQ